MEPLHCFEYDGFGMIFLRRIGIPILLLIALLALWNITGGHSEDSAEEIRPDERITARLPASVDNGQDVLTYHNDNFRTGQYLRETSSRHRT